MNEVCRITENWFEIWMHISTRVSVIWYRLKHCASDTEGYQPTTVPVDGLNYVFRPYNSIIHSRWPHMMRHWSKRARGGGAWINLIAGWLYRACLFSSCSLERKLGRGNPSLIVMLRQINLLTSQDGTRSVVMGQSDWNRKRKKKGGAGINTVG
jgi:hypothetical protein